MSITAKIHHGSVTLPRELNIPDGTEVEVIIPTTVQRSDVGSHSVHLPTFNGGGLLPGVNLDNSREMRRLLDESGKLPQLP